MEFTEQQQRVIAHDHKKNGVVRAGPGTGKSLTVVALAQRLAADHPDVQIRFVTFTRAATSELIKKIISAGGKNLKPSTIHSFATSVLMQNQDALPTQLPLRIPSDYEQDKIIYPYIGRVLGIRSTRVKKMVQAMASMWESLDPDFSFADITATDKARFIAAFQNASRLYGFTLLSQLPDLLRRLLTEHTDVKGLNFQFLIIDEFQDLNKCEIELLKQLNGRGIAVLAVGDEDQSIYSFRKAHPIGIREFENHFSAAVAYDLSICHRCPGNLMLWAQHVIQGDLTRSARPTPECLSDTVAETKLLHFPGETSEAKGVAALIAKLIGKGMAAHEVLVLTRYDDKERFSKKIKELLTEKEIPVFDSKETKKLLDDKNVRLLFAYLRLLNDGKDSLAWQTLARTIFMQNEG
ncbi:MAG: ATP-dependent helicase [Patescibacteria group bacterium]|nr:ATP-dependent helicase [Patescibacteria group bacterium]